MEPEPPAFPDLSDIENISEIGDAIMFLEDHEVSWDQLETLEEMKERLILEYHRLRGQSYKTEVSKAIVEAGEDDEKKRAQLIEFLKHLVKVTSADAESCTSHMLGDFLKTEGTSSDIQRDCEQRVEDLTHGECILLVAGESSAGKSSVLNLLFGEKILPVHANSCTATITTVRYGHRVVKIIYKDSDVPTEEIQLDEDGKKRFNELVFMRGDEREDGHDIKEIQLYLPLWYLRKGLVLADTPGIGETEFLENYLVNYISKNQILGFVYVIMSDAAGGVKEDRLLLLLKMIVEEQRKSGQSLPFDPKAALFICNRFDAIPENERDKIKEHILERLGKFWPEFEASSAIFFSAQAAQRDVDAHPDYINAQYRTLLDSLQKLVNISMDRRIKATYKWIGKLLQRITHFLKSTVKRLDMSERDRNERSEKINLKISNLTSRATTVVQTLKAEIQEMKAELVETIRLYLQKPQVKFILCSAWKDDEIPEMKENGQDLKWVKERIDIAFYDRLCGLLQDWEEENGNIPNIEERVVNDIRIKLGLLEEEIYEIEHDMQSDNGSVCGDETLSRSSRRMSRRLTISYDGGGTIIDTPEQLPLQVLSRVKKEASTGATSENFITQRLNRRNTKAFIKNPEAWAKERAEKLLKKLAQNKAGKSKANNEGILEELVTQLLQRPINYVGMVEERVPGILDANKQLLQSIEEVCLSDRKNLARYESMMKDIENLRKGLKNYGEGYIFVDDFKSNEVKVLQITKTGESLARTFTRNIRDLITTGSEDDTDKQDLSPRGLWTMVSGGVLKQGEKEQPIAIKFYLPSSGVENTFEEVAKLRCLIHEDISLAEFLGIHHAELQLPAFVYSGFLQSVQRFILHSSNQDLVAYPILLETADAVSYIHSKGLVHMEISTSTVTVDENGSVRLTGACLPRRASLPLDMESAVLDFVYLSPQVLNGDLYITQSDVYGFGLLMYELLTKEAPFKKQRKFPFQSFSKDLNPHEMLFGNMDTDSMMSHRTVDLMKRCVEYHECDRPHMSDVRASISDIKGQFRRTSISWRTDKTASPASLFKTSMRREREAH